MKHHYKKVQLFFCSTILMMGLFFSANAAIHPFLATYSGNQENPPNPSPAIGTIAGVYDDASNTMHYMIVFGGLLTGTTAAHFHAPAAPGVNAPVVIAHAGFPVGVTAGTYTATEVLTDAQEVQLKAGLWYSNIHTSLFPGGEIRAQIVLGFPATLHFFKEVYSGSQEVPPNASPAKGLIFGVYDAAANRIFYGIVFAGLMTNSTAAHFHAPAAPGVNASVVIAHAGFPTGVKLGWYANTHQLTDEQETQLLSGLWYSNIHTTGLPGGEIRAQIMPQATPDSNCITSLSANPCMLWPPNHKMKDVTVHYGAGANCPGPGSCELSVTSNEPVNGNGDGNTSPDWEIIDDHHVRLRAERSGNGTGRIYTIKVTCKDQQGNTNSRTTMVTVPHDWSSGSATNCPPGQRESGLNAVISPNPGRGAFMLNMQTDNHSERIQIRITNMSGRIVSTISNLIGSQVVRIGDGLDAGVYFVKITQGGKSIQLKLVKVN